MKKVILFLAVIFGSLIFGSSDSYGGETTPPKTKQDSLMSKKWVRINGKYTTIDIYSEGIINPGKTHTIVSETGYLHYFLTNDLSGLGKTIEDLYKNFEKARLNKSRNGKYIVTALQDEKTKKYFGPCYLYEIVKITDKELVLCHVSPKGEYAAGFPNFVFKAEPLD